MREEHRRSSTAGDLFPIALVIAALYVGRAVLIPVALAVLMTFLLAPLVTRLQRLVHSRALAVACVTATVVAVVGSGVFAVGHQFFGLASQLPEYHDTIARKVRSIRESAQGMVSDAARTLRTIDTELNDAPTRQESSTAPPLAKPNILDPTITSNDRGIPAPTAPFTLQGRDPMSTIVGMMRPLLPPLATGLVVTLLLAMMLHSRESIRDRVIRIAGLRQISLTTQALEETGARVGRYLRAQSLINLIYGTVVYLGLMALGFPNAAVCGVIAGVLRFIPILGIWLGAALPAALAIAVFDGWGHLILAASLFIALELIANFVLEPWLYGASTGISSIGVVVAIIFWTWIWGGVGLVLAMPMTVCVMVFARQLPRLAVVPILFGDEPVLSEAARFYQRLLGGDEDDAAAILRTSKPSPTARDTPPQTMIVRLDAVVIPALSTARQELSKGAISDVQALRVALSVRDITLDWMSEQPIEASTVPVTNDSGARVACLPVNDEGDECAGTILAACLESKGISVSVLSSRHLLGEMLREAAESGARVMLLSATAPSSAVHTRRICKAVRRALPEVKLVVCSWNGTPGNAAGSGAETSSGAELVVTTLAEAVDAASHLISMPPEPRTA